jgi:hypothetical protein
LTSETFGRRYRHGAGDDADHCRAVLCREPIRPRSGGVLNMRRRTLRREILITLKSGLILLLALSSYSRSA